MAVVRNAATPVRYLLPVLYPRTQSDLMYVFFIFGFFLTLMGHTFSQTTGVLEAIIDCFGMGVVWALIFKGFVFALIIYIDAVLTVKPSFTSDVKFPVEKVTARLERSLSEMGMPFFLLFNLDARSVEHRLFVLLRNRFGIDFPTHIIVPKPFLAIRSKNVIRPGSKTQLTQTWKAGGDPEQHTTVSFLTEEDLEARSLAKRLETKLRMF